MNVSSIVAFTRDLPLVWFFIPTGFEHRFHILLLKYSYFITVSIAVQLFFYYNICFEESWIVLDDNYTFNFAIFFFFGESKTDTKSSIRWISKTFFNNTKPTIFVKYGFCF